MAETSLQVGVIGLGMIGGPVATSLARNGLAPAVYEFRDGIAETLEGIDWQLDSPQEVAQTSDIAIIAVLTADQAEHVLIGDAGVLSEDRPGLIVVLSTVSLDAVHHLARVTTDQLHEISLFLHYYAGWGNGTAVEGVVKKLLADGRDDDCSPATPPREG